MNGLRLKHYTLWLLLLLLLPMTVLAADPSVPNLEERISAFEAQRQGAGPDARSRAIMERAARDLAAAMPDPGLEVGSRAPDFSLPDAHGKLVRLADLLVQGPVIVTFYRGAWCPYCSLQLKTLRESLPHLEAYGARLVAISPQTPDRSRAQVEKDDYPFHVLSDLDDRVIKAYNLYFELPAEVSALYKGNFDLDIEAYNGAGRHGRPVPGTFVLDRQGIVRAAFADTDYRKRMEPQVMIDALEAMR